MNRMAAVTLLAFAAVTGPSLADDNVSQPHAHEHTTAATPATTDVPADQKARSDALGTPR